MYIQSIKQFLSLSEAQQSDILRKIDLKKMLFDFLENRQELIREKKTVTCKCCQGQGTVTIEPRNNDDIHASSIHACPRKLWFDLKKFGNIYTQKNSAELELIFRHGTKLHDMLQEYGSQGAWKTDEYTTYEPELKLIPSEYECLSKGIEYFPLAAKYKVRSSIDARVKRFRVDDVRDLGTIWIDTLHEYKSISAAGLAYMNSPKPVHKMQGTLYQALTNTPVIIYGYYGKDDKFICYPQRFDGYIWGEIEDKINEVLLMEDQADADIAVPIEKTAWEYDKTECVGGKYVSACMYYNNVCFPDKNIDVSVEVVKKRGRPKKND